MTDGYPLYPDLPEEAAEKFIERMNDFRVSLKKVAGDLIEEILNDYYGNLIDYVEGDAWNNFRQTIVNGLTDYNTRKVQGEYEFKKIRRHMFVEYRDEIIPDLNQDLLEENEKLKERIDKMVNEVQDLRNRIYR